MPKYRPIHLNLRCMPNQQWVIISVHCKALKWTFERDPPPPVRPGLRRCGATSSARIPRRTSSCTTKQVRPLLHAPAQRSTPFASSALRCRLRERFPLVPLRAPEPFQVPLRVPESSHAPPHAPLPAWHRLHVHAHTHPPSLPPFHFHRRVVLRQHRTLAQREDAAHPLRLCRHQRRALPPRRQPNRRVQGARVWVGGCVGVGVGRRGKIGC